jgi:hypothetical protein
MTEPATAHPWLDTALPHVVEATVNATEPAPSPPASRAARRGWRRARFALVVLFLIGVRRRVGALRAVDLREVFSRAAVWLALGVGIVEVAGVYVAVRRTWPLVGALIASHTATLGVGLLLRDRRREQVLEVNEWLDEGVQAIKLADAQADPNFIRTTEDPRVTEAHNLLGAPISAEVPAVASQ